MNIRSILENCVYSYELIPHKSPIRSCDEGAKYFNIDKGQTAPTLILKTENEYYSLIISGDRDKVDFSQISNLLGEKKVKLANPKEVNQITGFNVGSIPLVGLDLPCIIDKSLYKFKYIYGGSGELTLTLKIDPAALKDLNNFHAYLGS